MVLVTIITLGLDKAMFAGFGLYIVFQLFTGKWKEINLYLSIKIDICPIYWINPTISDINFRVLNGKFKEIERNKNKLIIDGIFLDTI